MARHVSTKSNFIWWGLLGHLILLGPLGIHELVSVSSWSTELIIAIVITAIANSLYFICLRRAYHYAHVALVYPLARSSPILIALWALLLFDENLSLTGWIGVFISVAGLWLLSLTAKQGNAKRAVPWALAAALFTSIYSLSDKVAVTHLPSFTSLLGFVSIGYFASFILLSLDNWKTNGRVIPSTRPPWRYVIPGSLFIGTSYALVIQAMIFLPAAYVVSLTNMGIVIATLISITIMHERTAWRSRLASIVVVLFGLFVIGFDRI